MTVKTAAAALALVVLFTAAACVSNPAEEISNATSTPTPTATPPPTYTPLPTYTPYPTSTPLPTATPIPPAAPLPRDGGWLYSYTSANNPFISLEAYHSYYDIGTGISIVTNESFYKKASIWVWCSGGDPVFGFHGGGPPIGLGETILSLNSFVQTESGPQFFEGSGPSFSPDSGSDDLQGVSFLSGQDSRIIAAYLAYAQRLGLDVAAAATSAAGASAVGFFDVTGFATNYQRLPCG